MMEITTATRADSLLLLDDDEGILRLERRRLEAAGYTVRTVRSTAEAREELRRARYALVILDYKLNEPTSGLEFYQQLRAEGYDVPAMLVTAFSDENRLFEAFRAGMHDVVPKSGEYLDYLPQAVDRVMAQIAAARQAVEAEALRESEERLLALNAQLERSQAQLRDQADELLEANRAKDLFLATLAHELRNPLAPIRFALTMFERDGLTGAQSQARDVIDRQLTHLVRLVDDLFDVSRITRNQLRVRRERVELEPIMRTAVEGVATAMAATGHHFALALPPSPTWLEADATRLAQVFTNLLHNAVKYTPAGGVIRFEADVDDGAVRVSVTDTGVGIEPGELPRVFDMFYQSADNRENARGGLGIGLMLVQRLVQMHGGQVTVHSEGPGRGARFVVSLPLADSPVVASPPVEKPKAGVMSRGLRVLVVDDNVDSAELLALVVEQDGHITRTAHDGEQAKKLFSEFAPQVALLDIGLPGISGYDLARRFRAEAGDSVCLVAITGWGQDEDKRRAREAGFDCHLVKPADPQVVARLLECVASGTPCTVCARCLS